MEEIKRLNAHMLRTVAIGGDALGVAPGGKQRAKGYVRAMLDAAAAVLSERTGDDRPFSHALARAVLRDEISPEEALRLHAEGRDTLL